MNPRVSWHDMPTGLQERIEAEAGPFIRAEQVGIGHNCLIGMVLHTTSRTLFLKGVPADHTRAVWTQANEAAINRHVQPVTAPLAFHVQTDGWDVLGFHYLAGHRHADLTPGSPDLLFVSTALHNLATLPAPEDVPLRTIEDRWAEYVGHDASLLAGSSIAHTDVHRHNIMIGDTAKLIDWAWPTLAAPWVDTACLGLQLIHAGHHPKGAERWCQQLPAYAAASEDAVSTFVRAVHAMWHEISTADPQPWKREIAEASERWAQYRGL
ncbi:hypothetical protein GCM10023322_79400 [Rugosimonospora acidiphila]|uniref:Phosphotransferase enzyme family protein n=1 Tax=Rugosimonospora acidiphila TaxID=556531 RepID=A0ABP9SQF8_9ACTN